MDKSFLFYCADGQSLDGRLAVGFVVTRVRSSQYAKGVQLWRRSVTGTLAVARIHIQLRADCFGVCVSRWERQMCLDGVQAVREGFGRDSGDGSQKLNVVA